MQTKIFWKKICLHSLAFMVLSFTLVVPALNAQTSSSSSGSDVSSTIESVATQTGIPRNNATSLLQSTLLWLLRIFTILAILSFIVSGIMFLFAGSDKTMEEKAKTGVRYSIIGIAVALASYIIVQLIFTLLSGTTSSSDSTGIGY